MEESTSILNTLDHLHSDTAVSLFFLSLAVLVTIVLLSVIVSRLVCAMHKNRLEAGLKQSLIEQGFSADEITRVVQVTAADKKPNPET